MKPCTTPFCTRDRLTNLYCKECHERITQRIVRFVTCNACGCPCSGKGDDCDKPTDKPQCKTCGCMCPP